MSYPAIESLDTKAWTDVQPLTKTELDLGFGRVLSQIDANLAYFTDAFPSPATKNNVFSADTEIADDEWTSGFWTGLLWLAYEYTQDSKYKDHALKDVARFYQRARDRKGLDHHDLGFLYTPSCVAAYKLTGDQTAKEAALLAADKLMERWQEKAGFFQAWGPFDSKEHHRFIIDCLLNIPLLWWASEQTGDTLYAKRASRHLTCTCENIIRPDGSAFHTFYMNPETGGPDHGATRQGYSDESAWARGQAWGIDGIALNMRLSAQSELGARPELFPYLESMRNYFLNRLPKDLVCYWDLIFGDGDGHVRDSSAAAIAVCGLFEMAELPECSELDKKICLGAAHAILRSLIQHYTSDETPQGGCILYHGVYSWHSGKGVDEGNSWGDYFFAEALLRASRSWKTYW